MCLELCQTSKIEDFTKNISNFESLTISRKHYILDIWQGSVYYSGLLKLFHCGSIRVMEEHLIYAKLSNRCI